MNIRYRMIMLTGIIVCITLFTGCKSSEMMLETRFREIIVGQSDATEVLGILPEEGMMHTTSSVSVMHKKGWSRELGIVTFRQEDSFVQRKIYLQKRSSLTHERLYLFIQVIVPAEVLEEPYESDMRKHLAILRYCHQAMIEDVKPFEEDQETVSQMGLARTALGMGIYHLSLQPRQAHTLLTEDGFKYDHTTLDKCIITLKEESDNIFTTEIHTSAMVDLITRW
ncbi:MAG: hypothetical protein JW860_02345 [Sedimentisphaerales bacterium]|nr:hypothetical protein [Sedimentisphaerales bacterium]